VDIDKKKQTKESAKAMMASLMMELNINTNLADKGGLEAA